MGDVLKPIRILEEKEISTIKIKDFDQEKRELEFAYTKQEIANILNENQKNPEI